ncbi:hypothetical protein TNCV_2190381 [Trichonephila clavipes]|uniref:Transposase n=1 Tax=Trichonephila clavipes TaxID=2585209 RepID=A0A8X6R3K0_TRICX|nr:hypothetical protein TNCV_2190381 [Trichonephila clavipes]
MVLMPYPPYSPDLAPSQSPPPWMKKSLKGERFSDVDGVKENMLAVVNSILPQEFQDYFEQWQNLSCRQSFSNISKSVGKYIRRIQENEAKATPTPNWCARHSRLPSVSLRRAYEFFVHLTVSTSLANIGFNFSSDNFTAEAGLYWAARKEMAYMVHSSA